VLLEKIPRLVKMSSSERTSLSGVSAARSHQLVAGALVADGVMDIFEIPELDKLHAAYASRGFKVVGVSVDEGGANEVKPFVTEQKIGYPIVVDPEGKLATLLATTVLPTSIVIDRTGHIVWKHFGVVDTNDATLKTALESALAAD